MKNIMNFISRVMLLYFYWAANPAQADTVYLDQIPSSWRLENYPGNNIVAWFTGSSCQSGRISFGSNATLGDKDRFWSLVMAAKVSGKRIGVAYDNSTTSCEIVSFYFIEE